MITTKKEQYDREQAEYKIERAKYVKLVRRIRSDITDSGLQSVRYKLELIEKMSVKELMGMSKSLVIDAYNEAIEKHLDLQKQKKIFKQ